MRAPNRCLYFNMSTRLCPHASVRESRPYIGTTLQRSLSPLAAAVCMHVYISIYVGVGMPPIARTAAVGQEQPPGEERREERREREKKREREREKGRVREKRGDNKRRKRRQNQKRREEKRREKRQQQKTRQSPRTRTHITLRKPKKIIRVSSWSSKPVLRALYLYYKVAIFQLVLETCTSRARLVLQSCDRILYLCYKVAI